MNAYIMFRNSASDSFFLSLTDKQIEDFYYKIIKLRGTCRVTRSSGSLYLGMRISINGEEWSIFRELISCTKQDGPERTVYFIDENRELEYWIFKIFTPYLDRENIDIISSDLDEVISCNGNNYLG